MNRLAALALVSLLCLLLAFASGAFWQHGRDSARSLIELNNAQAQATEASERARLAERRLSAALDKAATDTLKENAHAQAVHQDFSRRLVAGTVRVFVPANCPDPAASPAGSASGPELAAGRAELSPAFAQALDDLATDADAAVRERNQCIVAYAAAQAAVNQSQ